MPGVRTCLTNAEVNGLLPSLPSSAVCPDAVANAMRVPVPTIASGQTALDGSDGNSPFTSAFVKHVRTPGIEVNQMLTRVRVEVASATKNRQVPWANSSLLGEVYFAGEH